MPTDNEGTLYDGVSNFFNQFNPITRESDGETFEIGGADLIADVARTTFKERYSSDFDLRTLAGTKGFKGYVIEVIDRKSSAPVESEEQHQSQATDNSLKPITRVRVRIPEIHAAFPQPKGPTTEIDKNQGKVIFENEMYEIFEDISGQYAPPKVGTIVWVDWQTKTGNSPSPGSWLGPVYNGPVNKENPKMIVIPETALSKKAFASPIDQSRSSPNPGLLPMQFNNENEFIPIHSPTWNESTEPSSKYSNVLRDQATPTTKKYFPDNKEIYVDKKIDYSEIKTYNIIPYSIDQRKIGKGERKHEDGHFLPQTYFGKSLDVKTGKIRRRTSLFIIDETGGYYTSPFNNFSRNNKKITTHYNIALNSRKSGEWGDLSDLHPHDPLRRCTIRVTLPYGLKRSIALDGLSPFSVVCKVSSPIDAFAYLGPQAKEKGFLKEKLKEWIDQKRLPDGAEPFILGPWGTPGLRTGPNANQDAEYNLPNEIYEQGAISFARHGHYFLPTTEQAEALYELIKSLINAPPLSPLSWAFKKPKFHEHSLSWDFPAVGGGDRFYPSSHFFTRKKGKLTTENGYPWGHVGHIDSMGNKTNISYHATGPSPGWASWWIGTYDTGLSYKELILDPPLKIRERQTGIAAAARWGSGAGIFLEYYILARASGLPHKAAWYATLAAASKTYPKEYGGVGKGPSHLPHGAELYNFLEIGQNMWFKATKHIRG